MRIITCGRSLRHASDANVVNRQNRSVTSTKSDICRTDEPSRSSTECHDSSSCFRSPVFARATCPRCRTVAAVRGRRPRDPRAQLSGRHLPGAGQHDDRLPPREHGVVANGFYWRDQRRVEMWTAWNDCIQRPQIWDMLHDRDRAITSAVWFPLHSKGCGADYICTPAPVHNADGSESPWCFTRPERCTTSCRAKFGHFPLHHFWGPLAGIQSTHLDRGRPPFIRPNSTSRTSSTSICRTWITPPRRAGPTARPPSRPWSIWTPKSAS